jgi:multidrug efflux system membrane fusion protein
MRSIVGFLKHSLSFPLDGGAYVLALVAALSLAACSKPPPPEPKPRPVRAMTVISPQGTDHWTFSGEVRARHETKLAFRVPGKVLRRRVDTGDQVQRGGLLAELDAADFEHARTAVAAQLGAARAEHAFARDDLERYRELLEQKLISPAEFDRRGTILRTAVDRVRALEAQLEQAANQVGYARLRADHQGIVTSVSVEPGQVVTAGQAVLTLARLDEREVQISVPEQRLGAIRLGQPVTVTFWVASSTSVKGRIREISPSAEPASRTYGVRVSLDHAPAWIAFGMTATVTIESKASSLPVVPISALFEPQNAAGTGPRVWIVDESTSTVKSVRVRVDALIDGERALLDGLQPGQRVIVAGATRLREGQSVRIQGEDAGSRAYGSHAAAQSVHDGTNRSPASHAPRDDAP